METNNKSNVEKEEEKENEGRIILGREGRRNKRNDRDESRKKDEE